MCPPSFRAAASRRARAFARDRRCAMPTEAEAQPNLPELTRWESDALRSRSLPAFRHGPRLVPANVEVGLPLGLIERCACTALALSPVALCHRPSVAAPQSDRRHGPFHRRTGPFHSSKPDRPLSQADGFRPTADAPPSCLPRLHSCSYDPSVAPRPGPEVQWCKASTPLRLPKYSDAAMDGEPHQAPLRRRRSPVRTTYNPARLAAMARPRRIEMVVNDNGTVYRSFSLPDLMVEM